MIIINDKPGQLCNRLWAYSFFVAYALKHNISIYIPYFREYQSYFENLSSIQHVFFNIIKRPKILDSLSFHSYRLITKTLRIVSLFLNLKILRIYIDSNNWTREKWNLSLLNTKTRIYYTGSWFHSKDVSALLEYKNVILKLFEPKGTYKKNVDTIFGDLRLRYDVIIGIHIRRGDYVNFRGGSYLFDDSIYNKYMEVLRNECAIVRKNVCFFLSSDENICYPHFNEYELSYLEKPIMIEDLYALSKCDYILGPPSTFSMWASFIGDVPLRIVKYSNETITLNQFSPILYQNVFKNQLHFCHVDRNIDTDLHDKSFNVRPA